MREWTGDWCDNDVMWEDYPEVRVCVRVCMCVACVCMCLCVLVHIPLCVLMCVRVHVSSRRFGWCLCASVLLLCVCVSSRARRISVQVKSVLVPTFGNDGTFWICWKDFCDQVCAYSIDVGNDCVDTGIVQPTFFVPEFRRGMERATVSARRWRSRCLSCGDGAGTRGSG